MTMSKSIIRKPENEARGAGRREKQEAQGSQTRIEKKVDHQVFLIFVSFFSHQSINQSINHHHTIITESEVVEAKIRILMMNVTQNMMMMRMMTRFRLRTNKMTVR